MRRPLHHLLPLAPLLLALGCHGSDDPAFGPFAKPPQYGEPAGSDPTNPIADASGDSNLADPGHPPSETNLPTDAGGAADVGEETPPPSISPPVDVEPSSDIEEPTPSSDKPSPIDATVPVEEEPAAP